MEDNVTVNFFFRPEKDDAGNFVASRRLYDEMIRLATTGRLHDIEGMSWSDIAKGFCSNIHFFWDFNEEERIEFIDSLPEILAKWNNGKCPYDSYHMIHFVFHAHATLYACNRMDFGMKNRTEPSISGAARNDRGLLWEIAKTIDPSGKTEREVKDLFMGKLFQACKEQGRFSNIQSKLPDYLRQWKFDGMTAFVRAARNGIHVQGKTLSNMNKIAIDVFKRQSKTSGNQFAAKYSDLASLITRIIRRKQYEKFEFVKLYRKLGFDCSIHHALDPRIAPRGAMMVFIDVDRFKEILAERRWQEMSTEQNKSELPPWEV